jgi:hypothetical protein
MVKYLHLDLSYSYAGIEVVKSSMRYGEKEPLGYEP